MRTISAVISWAYHASWVVGTASLAVASASVAYHDPYLGESMFWGWASFLLALLAWLLADDAKAARAKALALLTD